MSAPLDSFIEKEGAKLIKLRAELAVAYGRPIPDEMWAYLDDQGWVGDAETRPRSEQVRHLMDRIKLMTGAVHSMGERTDSREAKPDRPPGAAVSARIDALSAIYAAWAQDSTDVQFFRSTALVRQDGEAFRAYLLRQGPYLGYRLIKPAEVQAWIKHQHDGAAADGDGDEHVRRLIMNRQPNEPSRTTNLSYVVDSRERTLTVDARSQLGKLAELADKLADRYRWSPAQAAVFALTGQVPEVFVYVGSAQIRYGPDSGTTTRVTMTLDPFLTPEQVAEVYARLRAQLRDSPPRSLSAKHYKLAEHVGPLVRFSVQLPGEILRRGRPPTPGPTGLIQSMDPLPGHTWQSLRRDWNAKYGDHRVHGRSWRYEHASNFTRDAQQAINRLLDPGWRMRDPRNQAQSRNPEN